MPPPAVRRFIVHIHIFSILASYFVRSEGSADEEDGGKRPSTSSLSKTRDSADLGTRRSSSSSVGSFERGASYSKDYPVTFMGAAPIDRTLQAMLADDAILTEHIQLIVSFSKHVRQPSCALRLNRIGASVDDRAGTTLETFYWADFKHSTARFVALQQCTFG